MFNHVALLGRLAQEPQIRSTQSGLAVANFDLAVQAPGRDAPADFIPVVCWDKTADFVRQYLAKGRQIVVEGRISTRKWTDSEGKNHKVVEVTANRLYFADSGGQNSGQSAGQSAASAPEGFVPVNDEGLPF